MNFIPVSRALPSFDKRVVVRTVDGYIFTAKLMMDEEGDFWVLDLPPSMVSNYTDVQEDIVSWANID